MSWRSIEDYQGGLAVATRLDPVADIPSDLGAYLRMSHLLWGRLVIPEIFLLHNRDLAERFTAEHSGDQARRDFEEFIGVAQPIINRNANDWNDSFVGHYEMSAQTENPLLVEGALGRRHAEYLDSVVSHDQCRVYATGTAIRRFGTHFRETLQATFDERALRSEGLNQLAAFIWDPDVYAGNVEARARIDGWTELSRGGVIRALRRMESEPSVRAFRPHVMHAARHAYAKNVLDSLNRDAGNLAQVPLVAQSLVSMEPGYQVRVDEDVASDMLSALIDGRLQYPIDTSSLLQLPWKDIHEISEHGARQLMHEARSRAVHEASQQPVNESAYALHVNSMIERLDAYLQYIASRVPARRRRPGDDLRVVLKKWDVTPAHATGTAIGYTVGVLIQGAAGAVAFALLECLGFGVNREIRRSRSEAEVVRRRARLREFLIR